MAVKVAAKGPVLVWGRWVAFGVLVGHYSKKECQDDHRSYVLVGVSPFLAARRMTPQVQKQHLMGERLGVNVQWANFLQVSLFPHPVEFQQVRWSPPADLLQVAVLMVQQELVFQLSLLVGACVQASSLGYQMSHVSLLALWGPVVTHNAVHIHPHCPHQIPEFESEAGVSPSFSFCHF